MTQDASTSRVRCFDALCTLPNGHKGGHYDRRDGATWPTFGDKRDERVTPDRVQMHDVVEDADGYAGTVVEIATACLVEYPDPDHDGGKWGRMEWHPAAKLKVVPKNG